MNKVKAYLREKLQLVPEQAGVYLMKNAAGEIIYVGKAVKLKNRLRSYFGNHEQMPSVKVALMVEKIVDFEYLLCANEKEALILESSLIKRYQPFYNVLLKDDHDYPYIRVSLDKAWPKVERAYRVYDDKLAGAKYFGPYMHGALTRALRTLEQLFPLASCNPDKLKGDAKPCLNYQIGKCIGTCAQVASREDYLQVIDEVCSYLSGDTKAIETKLVAAIRQAATKEAFEEAAFWRDKLNNLQELQAEQRIVGNGKQNADIIALATSPLLHCLQKLEIREGKIVGGSCFFIEQASLEYTLYDQGLEQERGLEKPCHPAVEAGLESEFEPHAAKFDGADLKEAEQAYSLSQLFITQHYEKLAHIPKKIYFNKDLPQNLQENLSNFLSETAGHKVELSVPKKGEALTWIKMAERNAEEALVKKNILNSTGQQDNFAVLNSLKKYMNLPILPERIEAFDVANLGNDYLCCAMAVFINGVYRKSESCLFKIRYQSNQDDYLAMSEALVRRMRYLLEKRQDNDVAEAVADAANRDIDFVAGSKNKSGAKKAGSLSQMPNLILLDGSKGHRHAVLQALERAYGQAVLPVLEKVAVGGMVKDNKHRTRALLLPQETLLELQSATHDAEKMALLRFLTQVQNEVHRLANNYYRVLQRKKIMHYELEDIPGIGPAKRKKLLAAFKTLNNIRNSSLADLIDIGKLNKVDAAAVYNYFQLHGGK